MRRTVPNLLHRNQFQGEAAERRGKTNKGENTEDPTHKCDLEVDPCTNLQRPRRECTQYPAEVDVSELRSGSIIGYGVEHVVAFDSQLRQETLPYREVPEHRHIEAHYAV